MVSIKYLLYFMPISLFVRDLQTDVCNCIIKKSRWIGYYSFTSWQHLRSNQACDSALLVTV